MDQFFTIVLNSGIFTVVDKWKLSQLCSTIRRRLLDRHHEFISLVLVLKETYGLLPAFHEIQTRRFCWLHLRLKWERYTSRFIERPGLQTALVDKSLVKVSASR
eukprot:Gregarina_sp_Poly_1__4333@NODE_234_length_11010_cov_523_298456_g207_i0_p12_GENE_NODE_234_length_11010_cov_523_298456_g207_i0NODE_234_length_11010_cov_523_298456_g207_i0_p12_ORF_typecomplete_len104_score10_20_NODE_234_length_11010_cov_523_298456_g207_i010441355